MLINYKEKIKQLQQKIEILEQEKKQAIDLFYKLDSLIETASKWINDSTQWHSDEYLESLFNSLYAEIALLSKKDK